MDVCEKENNEHVPDSVHAFDHAAHDGDPGSGGRDRLQCRRLGGL